MNVNRIKLKRLMKMSGCKIEAFTITYPQAVDTKKYFEDLLTKEKEVYAIATLVDSRELVFSYSCSFEAAVKYLQSVVITKIKEVNIIKEEIVEKQDLYLKIVEL